MLSRPNTNARKTEGLPLETDAMDPEGLAPTKGAGGPNNGAVGERATTRGAGRRCEGPNFGRRAAASTRATVTGEAAGGGLFTPWWASGRRRTNAGGGRARRDWEQPSQRPAPFFHDTLLKLLY